ncbi:MAG: 2OG-Fe(II) oxygenase [Acidobacteriota bacterium]
MINFERIARHSMETDPFRWAAIDELFSPGDADALAATFPCDHFKLVTGYGGEKDYEYEARADRYGIGRNLIQGRTERRMAGAGSRSAISGLSRRLVRVDRMRFDASPMEANVFHYGPGASLGPHPDLADKIVTHVLYFNQTWNREDGGCLSILRSADPSDIVAQIAPLVGNSAALVRSENSWHAVSRVVNERCPSRRSMTVTFYREGSVSTMWPPGDTTPLHSYRADDLKIGRRNPWARLLKKLSSWKR